MSFLIRDFRAEDRLACALIFARAWNHAFPHAPREISAAVFDVETAEEDIRVAVADEISVGFASLYAPNSFLHHLYVEPDAQHKGIGAALLQDSIARAQSALSLKCQISNMQAMGFYKKRGFTARDHDVDAMGAWVRLYAPNPSSL